MISGRGIIDSLDLCDFLKRKVCDYFVQEFKSGRLKDQKAKAQFSSEAEFAWTLKYRTEKMTLDRLVELMGNYRGTDTRKNFRVSVIHKILTRDLSPIQLNTSIREHLEAGGSDLLNLDFLTNLAERLDLDVREIP